MSLSLYIHIYIYIYIHTCIYVWSPPSRHTRRIFLRRCSFLLGATLRSKESVDAKVQRQPFLQHVSIKRGNEHPSLLLVISSIVYLH